MMISEDVAIDTGLIEFATAIINGYCQIPGPSPDDNERVQPLLSPNGPPHHIVAMSRNEWRTYRDNRDRAMEAFRLATLIESKRIIAEREERI